MMKRRSALVLGGTRGIGSTFGDALEKTHEVLRTGKAKYPIQEGTWVSAVEEDMRVLGMLGALQYIVVAAYDRGEYENLQLRVAHAMLRVFKDNPDVTLILIGDALRAKHPTLNTRYLHHKQELYDFFVSASKRELQCKFALYEPGSDKSKNTIETFLTYVNASEPKSALLVTSLS